MFVEKPAVFVGVFNGVSVVTVAVLPGLDWVSNW